jgi:hypothetical protein
MRARGLLNNSLLPLASIVANIPDRSISIIITRDNLNDRDGSTGNLRAPALTAPFVAVAVDQKWLFLLEPKSGRPTRP